MPRKPENFTKRAAQVRAASLRWYHRQAALHQALGLTTRGTPRKLKAWPELHGLPEREQHKRRQQSRRAGLAAQGLTTRGTQRQHYRWPELHGLAGRDRQRVREGIWYYRRTTARARSTVSQLLTPGHNAALAMKLKEGR